jgi:hypothetical protein
MAKKELRGKANALGVDFEVAKMMGAAGLDESLASSRADGLPTELHRCARVIGFDFEVGKAFGLKRLQKVMRRFKLS